MNEDVKNYHFAREYRQKMALNEEQKIRAIRENIPAMFAELNNMVKKSKQKNVLTEEIKMAEEVIRICTSRYGENLERLQYADDSKIREIYRALGNFIKALLEKSEEKTNQTSDQSIERL